MQCGLNCERQSVKHVTEPALRQYHVSGGVNYDKPTFMRVTFASCTLAVNHTKCEHVSSAKNSGLVLQPQEFLYFKFTSFLDVYAK